jgi:hypothetical protein
MEEALEQAGRIGGDELWRSFDDSEWDEIGLGKVLVG